jgi:quinol-cytochrome oxidoreductase complex cytochrome b subunit
VRSARFRPVYKQVFWLLFIDTVILGIVGAKLPNEPVFASLRTFQFVHLGQIATAYYFIHFIVLMPLIGWFEKPKPLPKSISEPVLEGAGE